MELVYLWIEDYKNIDKQGFNFSPRFNCDYDEKTNKLTIYENDDYIENFFGDNINVTTIVGENGSGKSSVLEFLTRILILEDNGNTFKENKSFFYVLSNKLKPYNFTYYSYGIASITSNEYIYKYFNEPIVKRSRVGQIDLYNHFYMSYLNISHFSRDNIIENDKQEDLSKLYYLGIYGQNDFSSSSLGKFKEFNLSRFFLEFYELIGELLSIPEYRQVIYKTFNIENINSIHIKTSEDRYSKEFYEVVSIEKWEEYKLYLEENNFTFLIEDREKYKDFFKKTYKLFSRGNPLDFSFRTKNKERIHFSSGEIAILFYLEKIARILFNFINLSSFNKKKTILLLIDEIDLFLHPSWQKKIIKILVDFISMKYDFKFHIIITTHSPFLLSDIPKQNIIFLDTDEKGNGKVVNGLKDKKQTFGANIHTLLSDSFFMEDGLMGEFAKGKIDDLISYLNDGKSTIKDNDEAQKLLNIIGEPLSKINCNGCWIVRG